MRLATPALPLALGVLYALGFLVVNIRLFFLGPTEIELVRARYVVVGLMFVVLVSLPLVTYEVLLDRSARVRPTTLLGRFLFGARGAWSHLTNAVWTLVLLGALEWVVTDNLASRIYGSVTTETGARIAAHVLVLNGALISLWLLVRFAAFALGWVVAIPLGPPLFLILLVAYARVPYVEMPPWLGGGIAQEVSVVLTAEGRMACDCTDLKLIDEDTHRFIFESPDSPGRALVIARTEVIAIQYKGLRR